MQRRALKAKTERGNPVSEVRPVPPPVGGWNARDPLSAMPATDAIKLDNLTPMDGGIDLRPGSADYANSITGLYVETLMSYASPSTEKLFAAAETAIWDITSAGAAVSSLTGKTNGRWQHAMLVNAGNSYLMAVNNSADGLIYYNGSGWSTASLTGTTPDVTKMANICIHQNRIWLCQDDSLDVWYLGTGAVTGATAQLLTSTQFTKGGKVMAMASWSRDGGAGMDDVFAIISSKGEVLIYSGTDPTSTSTWTKVGLFSVPEPIGRRCVIKYGGDLAILTKQGLVPMSEVLQRSDASQAVTALTDKIRGAFADAANLYSSSHGWQVIEYPRRALMIINIPVSERETSHQYVINTRTGAWCRWLSLNANVWGRKGDSLYFGRNDGTVQVFDAGFEDDGAPIDGICVQAYNHFDDQREKTFQQFKPQLHKPEGYRPLVDVVLDFEPDIPSYTVPVAESGGWTWSPTTPWNELAWGRRGLPSFNWLPIRGHGIAAALVVAVSADSPVSYNGGLVRYESGD